MDHGLRLLEGRYGAALRCNDQTQLSANQFIRIASMLLRNVTQQDKQRERVLMSIRFRHSHFTAWGDEFRVVRDPVGAAPKPRFLL